MARRVAFFFVSLLLVFSVTGKNGGRGGAICPPMPASCCCPSGCGPVNCCPAPASSPTSSPAAPARATVTDDSAWLANLACAALPAGQRAPRPLPSPVTAIPRAPAVPLFLSGGGLLR